MSAMWFLTKIKYEKVQENGMQKKVTEQYLVDAVSFSDAEARIIGEMTPYIEGEFRVIAIQVMNLAEVWSPGGDGKFWYKVKSSFVTLDEKSAAEKKTAYNYLVFADSTADAEKKFHECMKGTMADYVVEGVVETKIMDVYRYELENEKEDTR